MSSALLSRIARPEFHKLVVPAQATTQYFQHGQAIGWSGFSPTAYPKAVPAALAQYVEENKLQNQLQFDLFVGASVGPEVEDRWARNGMIRQRWPFQSSKVLNKEINAGRTLMGDIHLSSFAHNVTNGVFNVHEHKRMTELQRDARRRSRGFLDVAVIEATEITSEGGIVLGGAVGIAPEIADIASKVIIEVNTAIPSMRGWHDIIPELCPPFRKPFLITRVDDRIGDETVKVDPSKVVAIVESNTPDAGAIMKGDDGESGSDAAKIASHIIDLLSEEVRVGRLPKNLLPLQSGIGNIANAVVAGLVQGPFDRVNVWTEVLQDSTLDYFESGKLNFASTVALSLSKAGFQRVFDKFDFYRERIVLRPQQIANSPELIRRLGVIAMNSAIEVDIYGHANSTLVNGSRMLNGIGGSGDFLRNAYMGIIHVPSARKTATGWISSIVPKAPHIDHTEHDVAIVVTEQGVADLRGLTPRARARELIKVAHPLFRDQLSQYLELSEQYAMKHNCMHEPHMLDKAFKMHINMQEKGTMLLDSW